MAAVTIRVGDRNWRVACDDGQEDHLRALAEDVDDRVRSLVFSMEGSVNEGMALLLSALTMADEITELKRENELLRTGKSAGGQPDEHRIREMEAAMAATLEEIAHRIEKIAEQAETR